MQETVAYVLSLVFVVVPMYLFIKILIWLIRVEYQNQSMLLAFPLP